MNEERFVVVSHERGRARGGGDRVHYTVPVTLDVALEHADQQRDLARAGGRGDWYRVCELVDVGHGGGTPASDGAQAKAVLMARCGISEPAAHGVLQRLAMDLRIDKLTAARILLAGLAVALTPAEEAADG